MVGFVIIEKEEHSKWSVQAECNGEFMTWKNDQLHGIILDNVLLLFLGIENPQALFKLETWQWRTIHTQFFSYIWFFQFWSENWDSTETKMYQVAHWLTAWLFD